MSCYRESPVGFCGVDPTSNFRPYLNNGDIGEPFIRITNIYHGNVLMCTKVVEARIIFIAAIYFVSAVNNK